MPETIGFGKRSPLDHNSMFAMFSAHVLYFQHGFTIFNIVKHFPALVMSLTNVFTPLKGMVMIFDKGLALFGSLKITNVSHFGAMGLDFNECLILWGPGA